MSAMQAAAVWAGKVSAGLLTLDGEGTLLQWPSAPPEVAGPGWVLPEQSWSLGPSVEMWQPT